MTEYRRKKEAILGTGVKIAQNGLHLIMMYVIANLLMTNYVMNVKQKKRKKTVGNNEQ